MFFPAKANSTFSMGGSGPLLLSSLQNSSWCAQLLMEWSKRLRSGLYVSKTTATALAIAFPVLVVFGLLGNIISFAVIRPTARKSTASFYLCCLAVFDCFCLLFSCSSIYFGMLWPSLGTHYGWSSRWIHEYLGWPIVCKLRLYLGFVTRTIAVWTIVIFTVERTIVIKSPLRGAMFCTMKKAVIAIVSLIVISFPLNSFALFSFNGVYKRVLKLKICVINKHFIYINFIDVMLLAMLPGLIILVCNITIVLSLRRKATVRRELCNNNAHDDADFNSSRDKDITRRLLLVSTVFIICTLPLNIFTFIRNTEFFRCKVATRIPPHTDLLVVFLFMFHINSGINFLLYSLTSHQFRHGVVGLLSCSRRHLEIAREKNCSGSDNCLLNKRSGFGTPFSEPRTVNTQLLRYGSEPELKKLLTKSDDLKLQKFDNRLKPATKQHPSRSMGDLFGVREGDNNQINSYKQVNIIGKSASNELDFSDEGSIVTVEKRFWKNENFKTTNESKNNVLDYIDM